MFSYPDDISTLYGLTIDYNYKGLQREMVTLQRYLQKKCPTNSKHNWVGLYVHVNKLKNIVASGDKVI